MPSKPHSPMTQAELATTDGGIAVGNLGAAIAGAEGMVKANPTIAGGYTRLIRLLLLRGEFMGRIADYERAAAISAQQIRIAPKEPQSYQNRAATRSVFHDFAGALADLDQSEKLGADPASNLDRRASILLALGRADEARALLAKVNKPDRDILSLGAEAVLRGERGDLDQAEALFIEAQRHLPDVSPFPLAWLYLQEGLMWESAGHSGRARELYAAAVARVPGYGAATSHLAAMEAGSGDRDRAVQLLRGLIGSSDDPESQGQLAALLKEAGQAVDAESLRKQAAERYAELLKKYPAAFASHAARFYLGIGAEAQSAVRWAEQNLKNSPTAEARSLAIEANLTARATARACALAEPLMTPRADIPPRIRVVAARALSACGKKDAADTLLKSIPPK